MNIRIILLSVLCTGLSLSLLATAVKKHLAAKPVVFFNVSRVGGFDGVPAESLEFSDTMKRGQGINNCYTVVYKKLRDINMAIAKRLGACAVIRYYEKPCLDYEDSYLNYDTICVDPAYDITNEAIDQLNKEYLAGK